VLERALGIPVVAAALARGRGSEQVRQAIATILHASAAQRAPAKQVQIAYPPHVEAAIASIAALLNGKYQLSRWTMALLLLQDDEDAAALVREHEPEAKEILQAATAARARFEQPPELLAALALQHTTRRVLAPVLTLPAHRPSGFAEHLGAAMMRPLTGIPILLLTLYLIYQFVGVLGAQVLVDYLEYTLFGAHINPWVDRWLAALIPWEVVRQLFGGEYGVITLGVRYAFAIVLPVVGTFFLAFSVIEDSGYLPRLAMLVDRLFKKIGLSGRAVIPMVLGFGCDTMATIVARTLETRRERVISTLLLALAIPCSAQLGVMLGLMGGKPLLLAAWTLVMAGVFLLVGYLAAQVTPGERPTFYMELPPLRFPTVKNVLVKTLARMEWYFREVLPLFVLASVIIWLGQLTGLFDAAIGALTPVMRWLGLPEAAAPAFLFGFFRRDYGAAGLYDLRSVFTDGQLLVATVTMTLFIPCIAQLAVMFKERGAKTALGIFAFIFPFALLVGGLLHRLLVWLGVS